MYRRLWLLALPLLLAASPVLGQVSLARKFTEGDSYKTKATVKSDQKLTIGGQDGSTNSNTVVEQKTTVGKRDAEGKLPISVETAILSSEIGLPGNVKIKFDAANPDAKDNNAGNPLAELVRDKLKANAKMSNTIVLGKDNQIVDVQGVKAESGITAEDVKDQHAEEAQLSTKKDLKKGDTWEQEVKMNLGSGQIFTLKRKYTYEGEASISTVNSSRKVYKITAQDQSVVFSIKEGGALPGKVTKSDLKVVDSKYTILFDPQLGRAAESTSMLHVSGGIGLSIMGTDLDGDLDLTMNSKVEEVK
jgi:hypothetical protein